MAVQRINIGRIFRNIHSSTIYLQKYLKQSAPSNNSTPVDLEDALDNFTTELMQRKKYLWDLRNEKLNSMKQHIKNKHFCSNFDVRELSREKLNEVLSCALAECNDIAVIELVKECLKFNICPSTDSIPQVLSICAQNGAIDLIQTFEELCIDQNISLPPHFSFEIYKADAIWMKGNVYKGLEIFQELYRTDPFQRRPVRMKLKLLISTGIKNNSEGVLIHFLKVAKNFIKNHKDYFFLISIWEYCFTSEWYSDQQRALVILNENTEIAEMLSNRLPFMLTSTLKNHRTEIVYKLLETFYNIKMGEQCTIVAMALLDYYSLQVNIGNYSEIVKWCQRCEITLPSIYNRKYLDLLLQTDSHTVPVANKTKEIDKRKDFVF